jgi:photosystem II stability/assembly factor-like uncharacterized protein
VHSSLTRRVCAAATLAVILAPASVWAQRWQVQYFYDKGKSTFNIADLQFLSEKRGIAVGVVTEGRREDPTSVVTSDGGAHWQVVPLKEAPVSLFFLNESLGWMVTIHGLWQTTEAGKNWVKMPKLPSEVNRVFFLDEKRGWGIGGKKTVVETVDGGHTWTKLAAADEPPGNPLYSAYNWVAFATPLDGIITGFNLPPRLWGPDHPGWLDPQATLDQRDTPHLNYSLVTHDGGKTWRANSASLFGESTRIRFTKSGTGLGLVEYSQMFRYPSEAYKLEWKTNKSDTVYKDGKFSVTDIWLTPDGTSYLAGTLSQGKLRSVIPGKVQVLFSKDFGASGWNEMKVDYRAVATRTLLSGVDDQNVWLATDNGMILKLVREKTEQ